MLSSILLLSIASAQGFVKTRGMELVLDDKPFYFGGQNAFDLAYKPKPEIDNFFAKLKDMNTTVVRAFAWQERDQNAKKNEQGNQIFFQDFKNGTQVFNDDIDTGIGRFDYILKSAKDHKLKLILALAGNWDSFGGIDYQRNQLAPESKFHSDYFTLNVTKNAYKAYVSHFLSRVNSLTGVAYKDDPTIAIVEMMNEPRCMGSNVDNKSPADPTCTPDIITSWATEMSAFIKTVDQNHLLSLGDEGFWAKGSNFAYPGARADVTDGTNGIDTVAISKIKDLDVLSLHSYFMTQWYIASSDSVTESKQQAQQFNNTIQYMIDHALVSKQANKPVYVGEFGHWTPSLREQVWPAVQQSVLDNGIAGFAPWLINTKDECKNQEKQYEFCADDDKLSGLISDFNTKMSAKSISSSASAQNNNSSSSLASPISARNAVDPAGSDANIRCVSRRK